MKRMIGMSIGLQRLNARFFADMMSAGIGAVEVSCAYNDYPLLNYKTLEAEATREGIQLWSFHYPFHKLNLASHVDGVRDAAVSYLSELTKKASDVGIKTFVVHASNEPVEEATRGESLKYAIESLQKIGDVAQSCGVKVAVESLPRTCLGNCHEDILTLIGDHPALGVCFDTNHLTKEPGESFVEAVAPRLLTLHLSDFDYINERHWLPGEGKIAWPSLIQAIENTGYGGPLMYEVPLSSTANIDRERDLVPADFAANAEALLAHQNPTPHDIPPADLGFWGRTKK